MKDYLSIAKALALMCPGEILDKNFVIAMKLSLEKAYTEGYEEAIDDAAAVAANLSIGLHSPHEYRANVEAAIKRLKK